MTSLSGKEKATARNMKIMKGKISLVKQTYRGKKSPHTKLVGWLKDKSSKFICIHHKQLKDTQNN